MRRRHPSSALVGFIKRWRVRFGVAMVLTYAVAIVILVVAFPDVSNLWVSIFVLGSGFFAGLMALGDLLVSAEESVRDDGGDPSE